MTRNAKFGCLMISGLYGAPMASMWCAETGFHAQGNQLVGVGFAAAFAWWGFVVAAFHLTAMAKMIGIQYMSTAVDDEIAHNGGLNIYARSVDARARLLSALANRPFQIGRQMFASLEGFYQGIKFGWDDPRRERAFASSFGYAKQFSDQAGRVSVWWDDEVVPYASLRHKEIIEIGFRASFDQNPDRLAALVATRGLRLRHETGEEDEPDAPLTRDGFCALLTKIRSEAP